MNIEDNFKQGSELKDKDSCNGKEGTRLGNTGQEIQFQRPQVGAGNSLGKLLGGPQTRCKISIQYFDICVSFSASEYCVDLVYSPPRWIIPFLLTTFDDAKMSNYHVLEGSVIY